MRWAVGQQAGRQFVNLIVLLVMARLTSPDDLGDYAIALSVVGFFSIFSDLGLGAALVQRHVISAEHFSSVFFAQLGIGALLALASACASGAISGLVGRPEVQPLAFVLSAGLVVSALSSAHVAMAQRRLDFRTLAARDVISAVVAGTVAIVAASYQFGAWSFVLRSLGATVIGSILVWRISPWQPRLSEVSVLVMSQLWPFSSRLLAFGVFKACFQNADRLLIGYFFGAGAVGLYSFATQLIVAPVASSVGAIGIYLFARWSRGQDDVEYVRAHYGAATRLVSALVSPSMMALCLLTPILVPFVVGEQWRPAIVVAQGLTGVATFQAATSLVGQVMKAFGRSDALFAWSVCITFATLGVMFVGAAWGLTGLISGLVLVNAAGAAVSAVIAARLLGCSDRSAIDLQGRACLATAGVNLALALLALAQLPFDTSALIAVVLSAVLIYAVSYGLGWRRLALDLAFARGNA